MKLKAEKRGITGKKVGKERKQGKIPGVMYGKEFAPVNIFVDAIELNRIINKPDWESKIYTVDLAGEEQEVIIKKVDFDTYKHNILHVDFYAIKRGEKIEVNIPIILTGEPIGVKKGGLIEQQVKEIKIKCLPKDLPEHFTIDISDMDVEDYKKIKDIEFDEKYEVLNPLDEIVVIIGVPAKAKAEAAEEEAATAEEATEETESEQKDKE